MTLREAKAELAIAYEHIYNVEKALNVNTSHVRRAGYNVRLALADWENQLRTATNNDNSKTIDSL